MSSVAASTAAVIVAYHPRQDLTPLLQSLRMAVGRVVVVDNSCPPHAALPDWAAAAGALWLGAGNVGGLAGAYNKALALLETDAAVRHVVFVDEDSDTSVLHGFLSDGCNAELLSRPDTAAIAPAYRDRATAMRARYMRLQRWRLSYLPRQFDHVEAVAFVINSMSVWRRDALRRLGRFDEQLAIDHVDTDYCLRARHAGLRLYVNGRFEFAHSIGERRRYRLFGRELQAGGHSADRRRLIARNTVRLARAECLRLPAFGFLCLTRLAYELAGILMAEPQKWTKAMAVLRGAASGVWAARLR